MPLWIIGIIYIFWALALVCEEFLVPAISILCTSALAMPNPGSSAARPDPQSSRCPFVTPVTACLLLVIACYRLTACYLPLLVIAITDCCAELEIPDDVAGATLLAAGCNAPELFASIIAIYISNSPVGVGVSRARALTD